MVLSQSNPLRLKLGIKLCKIRRIGVPLHLSSAQQSRDFGCGMIVQVQVALSQGSSDTSVRLLLTTTLRNRSLNMWWIVIGSCQSLATIPAGGSQPNKGCKDGHRPFQTSQKQTLEGVSSNESQSFFGESCPDHRVCATPVNHAEKREIDCIFQLSIHSSSC